jgi:hypothetical protein
MNRRQALSWKIMSDEFYNLEDVLREKNIIFKSGNGIIIINHKGDVYLPSLTQLPNDVQFNNKGSINLFSLTQLPDNKEQIFKNDGIVYYNGGNQKYDTRN